MLMGGNMAFKKGLLFISPMKESMRSFWKTIKSQAQQNQSLY
jgi:hypothetical protein